MRSVCIDARLWGINHTGPGRYTENLVTHLPKNKDYSITLVVSAEQMHDPGFKGYKLVIARHHPYSFLSQLEMAIILTKLKPDIFHATHFTVPVLWFGKTVVTIHDLIKHYSRGQETTTRQPWLYWFKYLGYRFVMWNAIYRSAHIIVPSNYWKVELIRLYGISEEKVTVTYEAVSKEFQKQKSSVYKPGVSVPYVIHTGNLYPHKNISTLINAVDSLGGRIKLCLVCARSVFESRLPESPNLLFLGRLSDAELFSAYRHALAYVFPSFIEGFGLPGLEAMAAGTPVIASDASCLPEVYGDAAIYFNPNKPEELAAKLRLILSDSALRKKLVTKGLSKVASYSWEKMARQTDDVYKKLLS